MINQDTIKLLRECDAGTKMGISSIDDVLDNVCNPTFKQKLENSKKEHEIIEKDILQLLQKYTVVLLAIKCLLAYFLYFTT